MSVKVFVSVAARRRAGGEGDGRPSADIAASREVPGPCPPPDVTLIRVVAAVVDIAYEDITRGVGIPGDEVDPQRIERNASAVAGDRRVRRGKSSPARGASGDVCGRRRLEVAYVDIGIEVLIADIEHVVGFERDAATVRADRRSPAPARSGQRSRPRAPEVHKRGKSRPLRASWMICPVCCIRARMSSTPSSGCCSLARARRPRRAASPSRSR